MAIDTRNRRASCIGYSAPQRAVFPNPDGSLANQGDRQQSAYLYPGILAGEPVSTGVGMDIVVPGRIQEFLVPAFPTFAPNLNVQINPAAVEVLAPPPWRQYDRVP
jgi:hypothetical protein